MKGLELLKDFKNDAEVKKDGSKIKLVFEKPIKLSDTEESKEFTFTIPTLQDIEIALDATQDVEDENLRQLKQSYHLISSQFSPKFAPNDVANSLTVQEMQCFSKVLEPFLS